MIYIVLGTGFGDEGKGQCVHSLSHPGSLTIRFSGGHQCGHTVAWQNKRHIFSQIGAGSFKGASTYLSEYCTVFPTAFINEYQALQAINQHMPPVYIHPLAMVTTPYDLAFNRALSMITGHGTCGVGFGSTLQRNEDFYHLYPNDLENAYILETKLSLIERYYEERVKQLNISSQITYETELNQSMSEWYDSLYLFRNLISISALKDIESFFDDFVFEGSQGIMLDQHFGFFPHVTRSNTTSQNALEIIRNSHQMHNQDRSTYYVSRSYLTRHGNGPFPQKGIELINTGTESNTENDWQGIFRTAQLDTSLLKHAVNCDRIKNYAGNRRLVITCMDQLKDPERFLHDFKDADMGSLFERVCFKNRPDWEQNDNFQPFII